MALNIPYKQGGGVFMPDGGIVSDVLASGQTGVLLVVPEVEGIVYKLTHMVANSTSPQSGMGLIVNGATLHDAVTLDDTQPTSSQASSTAFSVAQIYGTATVNNPRKYSHIFCKSFSFTKDAGNTTEAIAYVYEIGRIKQ